jgi:hypothetical protein
MYKWINHANRIFCEFFAAVPEMAQVPFCWIASNNSLLMKMPITRLTSATSAQESGHQAGLGSCEMVCMRRT